jgi:CRP-like cAMP-binding protein
MNNGSKTPKKAKHVRHKSHGSPNHWSPAKKVFVYNNKGSFGELALMYHSPRAATVIASSSGILWAVDRKTFRHIIVSSTARKRKKYDNFLKSMDLFLNISEELRSAIADVVETKIYAKDEVILHRGQVGNHFYIIEKGTAVVTLSASASASAASADSVSRKHSTATTNSQNPNLSSTLNTKLKLGVNNTDIGAEEELSNTNNNDSNNNNSNGAVDIDTCVAYAKQDIVRSLMRGDFFGERGLLLNDVRSANVIVSSPRLECAVMDKCSFLRLLAPLYEKFRQQMRIYVLKQTDAANLSDLDD